MKLGLIAAISTITGALAFATFSSSGTAEGADACQRTDFRTEMVRDACKAGGQKAAKDAMKKFNKDNNIKSCNQCHTKLAPTYELKDDAYDQFAKLGGKLIPGKGGGKGTGGGGGAGKGAGSGSAAPEEVSRGALVALLLVGCWRGDPPAAPAPTPLPTAVKTPLHYPWASVAAVHDCTAQGPTALVVWLTPEAEAEQIQSQLAFDPSAALPVRVDEGKDLEISICAFHGCTNSWLAIDTIEIGRHATGRYRIAANAGGTYEGAFSATWVGEPWQVRPCPHDMNPP